MRAAGAVALAIALAALCAPDCPAAAAAAASGAAGAEAQFALANDRVAIIWDAASLALVDIARVGCASARAVVALSPSARSSPS